MGKISYTFDTNDPEDREAINRHAKAEDMAQFIWELIFNFDYKSPNGVGERLEDLLNEYGIDIENLTS